MIISALGCQKEKGVKVHGPGRKRSSQRWGASLPGADNDVFSLLGLSELCLLPGYTMPGDGENMMGGGPHVILASNVSPD